VGFGHTAVVLPVVLPQVHQPTLHAAADADGTVHSHAQTAPFLCALQAGAAAKAAYGLDPSSPYMPHLSLLYSNADEQQRQAAPAAFPCAAAHLCALFSLFLVVGLVPASFEACGAVTQQMRLNCPALASCRREIVAEKQQRLFGAAHQQRLEGKQPPLLQADECGFDVDSLTGGRSNLCAC
jgi:hypothetical protein